LKLRKTLRDSGVPAKPSLEPDASPRSPPASKRVGKERDRRAKRAVDQTPFKLRRKIQISPKKSPSSLIITPSFVSATNIFGK
jgi:hypothetical protein